METNKMAVLPVRKLLLTMSWPMMLSMLIQALYNLVDSVFVAQLSEDGFVALSLAYPVQILMISICVGTGVGVNSMLSRRLGEGKPAEANAVAVNGYFVYLVTWLAFLAFGLICGRPFIALFTNEAPVIAYGGQYVVIITALSIGMVWQFAGERVLQASGDAVGPMIIQGVGAVVNLILDPLLIFGLGPFPRLEVAGAALATVLGQIAGMLLGLVMVAKGRGIPVQVRGFRPSKRVIGDIYRIGFPAILMQALTTVMSMGMNKILGLFTDSGVFILGAYFKLQSFIIMPVNGLNNGLIPVVSFNYGTRSRHRVLGLIRFALWVAAGIMLVGTLILLIFPNTLMQMFVTDAALMASGAAALRLISLSFVCAGISTILCAVFQAVDAAGFSLLISLLRQVVVLLPAALALCLLYTPLVWLSFLIAEGVSCAIAILLYWRVRRNKILVLEG